MRASELADAEQTRGGALTKVEGPLPRSRRLCSVRAARRNTEPVERIPSEAEGPARELAPLVLRLLRHCFPAADSRSSATAGCRFCVAVPTA